MSSHSQAASFQIVLRPSSFVSVALAFIYRHFQEIKIPCIYILFLNLFSFALFVGWTDVRLFEAGENSYFSFPLGVSTCQLKFTAQLITVQYAGIGWCLHRQALQCVNTGCGLTWD